MEAVFIRDFAVVLSFAFVISLIFSRIKQPVVFGYMLAGVIIGPYALKLVTDLDVINLFADLGIVLLMYTLGLKFNIKKLRKVGLPALALGVFEISLMLGIGNTLGKAFGWSYVESIFLGGVIAFSSTAVIVKILIDMDALRKEHSMLILGILIVEDVGAIALLTILGSLSMVGADLLFDVAMVLLRISVFFLIALVFGLRFVPPFINGVKRTATKEILLLTSLGLCFSLAAFSDYLGFSVALGAFMMGAIISESRFKNEVEELAEPIRDIFASMFFISIGMLVDPFILKDFLLEIIVISILAIIGKFAVLSLGLYVAGYSGLTSMSVGLGMIPRGEFSFIIAKLGIDQGVVGPEFYLITVAVAMVTALVGPKSLESAGRLTELVGSKTPIQVKSFFKFSISWVHAISEQFKADSKAAAEFQKSVREIGINALILVIIYYGVVVVRYYTFETLAALGSIVFGRVGLVSPSWFNPGIFIMVPGFILSLPSFYLIIRNIRALIDLSVGIASSKFRFLDSGIVRNTLRNATYIITILIFTVTLLPIIVSEAFGHGMILDGSVLIFVLGSTYFFWRTISGFHRSLHEMIVGTILAEEVAAAPKEVDLIIESLKVERDFNLERIHIMSGSVVIGKSIAETKLRALTGVTIVAIERDYKTIRNPRPGEIIRSGDVLVIIGTEEERENAEKYLATVESPVQDEEFCIEKVEIKPGARAVGKTLAGTELRTLTGVTLIAIERGLEIIQNPKPQNAIKEDDVLLIIGTEEEIKNAREYLLEED